jgi:hypothetical protein
MLQTFTYSIGLSARPAQGRQLGLCAPARIQIFHFAGCRMGPRSRKAGRAWRRMRPDGARPALLSQRPRIGVHRLVVAVAARRERNANLRAKSVRRVRSRPLLVIAARLLARITWR